MQFPDLATLQYAVTLSAGHARRKKFRKRDDDSTPMKLYYTDKVQAMGSAIRGIEMNGDWERLCGTVFIRIKLLHMFLQDLGYTHAGRGHVRR